MVWLVLILFGLVMVLAMTQISAGSSGMGVFWLGVAATLLTLGLLAVIAIYAVGKIRKAQGAQRRPERTAVGETAPRQQPALDPTTALLLMALRPPASPSGPTYPAMQQPMEQAPQQPARLPNYWGAVEEQPVDGVWEDR